MLMYACDGWTYLFFITIFIIYFLPYDKLIHIVKTCAQIENAENKQSYSDERTVKT